LEQLYKVLTNGLLLTVGFWGLYSQSMWAQNVVINEIMTDNASIAADVDNDYSDWIELYNPTSNTINLSGYFLSDDENEPYKWAFPAVEVGAFQFLTVFASGKNYLTDELHTNFSISAKGEALFLSHPDGSLLDYVPPQNLAENASFGLVTDGAGAWKVFENSTYNTSNDFGTLKTVNSSLVINEFMSNNEGNLTDFQGDTSDWIELYNSSNQSIDLAGYAISDDKEEPTKWTFPSSVIEPQSFMTIFASGKDLAGTELHTNFSIKAEGESLILSNSDGMVIDSTQKQNLLPNVSMARVTDAAAEWAICPVSSPNSSNSANVAQQPLIFTHVAGQYTEAFEVNIFTEDGFEIRYTLDSSDPDSQADFLEESLLIESREGDPNYYSLFQATQEPYEPVGELYKLNIVRAQVFVGNQAVSKIHTRTYMVDEDLDRYTLPILSIVSDPDNFFDDTIGIYVTGANYDGESSQSMNNAQHGREWERPMHIDYLNEEGELEYSADGGIRIHGGGSRRDAQKAFRLYARSDYGPERFEYPFFDDKPIEDFKRLVLRAQSSSNDSYLTDEVCSNLVRGTNVGRMAVKPTVVFVDGEFWGIYHLRERIDEYYLEDNYDVDKDDVTLLEDNPDSGGCCIIGDADEFLDLLDYVENNDMTDNDVFIEVASKVDLPNYTDYLISEFYVANYDWPRNNIKYWKEDTEEGKWRWVFFDADFGMRFEERPSFLNFVDILSSNVDSISTSLGRNLLENPTYRTQFINRLEYLLNGAFRNEKVFCEIDYLQNLVRPHIQEYIDRFAAPSSQQVWEGRVSNMKAFSGTRACYLQDQVFEKYGISINIDSCVILADDFQCAAINVLHDAAITQLIEPMLPIEPIVQPVIVQLQNVGSQPLENVNIFWSVNNEAQPVYVYEGPALNQYQSTAVTLGTYDFSVDNTFDIEIWTEMPNGLIDQNMENDTLYVKDTPNALAGIYTIEPNTGDFFTVTEAVDFLNEFGATNDVVFNITSGTYTGLLDIQEFYETSCNNTITFQSLSEDSTDVVIEGVNELALKLEHGVAGLVFKNIAFASNIEVVSLLDNNCIEFLNCHFTKTANEEDNIIIEAANSIFTIANSYVDGGQTGIKAGASTVEILYSSFVNQEISIRLQDTGGELEGNHIIGEGSIGVWVDGGSLHINHCHIYGQATGIAVIGEFTDALFIEDNFIQSTSAAINANNIQLFEVTHNNFLLVNSSDGSLNQCVSIQGNAAETFELSLVANNIINLSENGVALNLDVESLSYFNSEANNIYSISDALIIVDDISYTTIEEINEIFLYDIAQYSVDPEYVSYADLHINNSTLFYNIAACSGTDIDGEMRTTPCSIGADEVEFSHDIAAISFVTPTNPIIANTPQTIEVLVKNYGTAVVDNLNIGWSVNDTIKNVYPLSSLGLAQNDESSVGLANYTFAANTDYSLKAWVDSPNGDLDQNISNDTVTWNFYSCIDTLDCPTTSIALHPLSTPTKLVLYPNPAAEKICIYTGSYGIERIQIWSVEGQLMLEESGLCNVINIDSFQKGIYLAKIFYQGEVYIQKISVIP